MLVIAHHLLITYAGSGSWYYMEGREDFTTLAIGSWVLSVNQAFFMGLFFLALILLLGSTIGAQFGVRLSKRLKGDQLKILLASIVLLVMVQMLLSLVLPPHLMLGHKGGH